MRHARPVCNINIQKKFKNTPKIQLDADLIEPDDRNYTPPFSKTIFVSDLAIGNCN